MVDERSLVDLTLSPGEQVVTQGRLERLADGQATLHVAGAWGQSRPGFLIGDDVAIRFADKFAPTGNQSVRIVGTWDGRQIFDAEATVISASHTVHFEDVERELSPSELGQSRFVEVAEALVASSGAPVIASGGTKTSLWLHVLYVTPELVRAHQDAPIKTDIFTSITPA